MQVAVRCRTYNPSTLFISLTSLDGFSECWHISKSTKKIPLLSVLQKLWHAISLWTNPALWMHWRAAFIVMWSVWLICSSTGMALLTDTRARSFRIPKLCRSHTVWGSPCLGDFAEPHKCRLHHPANLLHWDSTRHWQLCRQPGVHISQWMMPEITHLQHRHFLHGEQSWSQSDRGASQEWDTGIHPQQVAYDTFEHHQQLPSIPSRQLLRFWSFNLGGQEWQWAKQIYANAKWAHKAHPIAVC